MLKYFRGLRLFVLSSGFVFLTIFQLQAQNDWKDHLLSYIQNKLEKTDGGYGWEDQYDSHLTPTFAVVGILKNIDELPVDRDSVIKFIRAHHPQYGDNAVNALNYKIEHPDVLYLNDRFLTGKEGGASGSEMMDLIFQQIQSLLWLGGDVSEFKKPVANWMTQTENWANFEANGYPVFEQEVIVLICKTLLGLDIPNTSYILNYIYSRQRENGSFNNSPVKDDDGDGNILNTYWGIKALSVLNKNAISFNDLIRWIQSCQVKNGGFTHQPNPIIGDNDDVAYTWAAIKSLELLSAKPKDEKLCIQYLISLHNEDGGFGRQKGVPSSPMATYYAIDALKSLNALSYLNETDSRYRISTDKQNNYTGLKVFSAQIQLQGTGSPDEAVMLADSLGINLWGAKNSSDLWIKTAQGIADKKEVPTTFFVADEPYGKNVKIQGFGTFSHILDYIVPSDTELPLVGKDPLWGDYNESFVQPLLEKNGALILQISNNEPLARILLDESLKNGGYAAISTIHFNQNFLFWLPYLNQYRNQIPFIALQDAHGTEAWWWSDEILHYRTLFLAEKPTYDEFMKALKNNWVVAVRHDSLTGFKTRILGGADGVQQYLLSKQDDWKWWGDNPEELTRPWAAITVLTPNDTFEIARPDEGMNIRIRCWWSSKRPILNQPQTELRQLKINGIVEDSKYYEVKDARGRIMDSYYLYSIKDAQPRKYLIEASIERIKDGSVKQIKKEFLLE